MSTAPFLTDGICTLRDPDSWLFFRAGKAKEVFDTIWPFLEDISTVIDKPRIKGRKITLHVGPKPPEA